MANDYVVNIVLKAKEEAAAAFAGMSAHMAALTAETALVNEALKHLNNTANEHSQTLRYMGEDLSAATMASTRMAETLAGKLTPAMNNVNKASGNNGGAASGLMAFVQGAIPGQQTAGNITIAIAAAAAAFAPFTAQLAASLVLMGAWVVGAAAMATTLAIVVAPLALLTLGIVALGISATGGQKALDNLAPAQKAAAAAAEAHENALQALARAQLAYDNNPSAANLLRLQQAHEHVADAADKNTAAQQKLTAAQINANGAFATLDKHFESLVKTLGQQAVPIMAVWITYLDSLLPRLLSIGQSIMTWYGDRLPVFLRTVSTAVDAALPAIERLASAWGRLVDDVIARIPAWGPIVGGAFNFLIDAAIGLMQNLLALSDWFVARLPTLGANAQSTFRNIGIVVQALGSGLGGLVDWIIAHWPAVTGMFNASWDAFKQGWGVVQPILQAFGQNLKDLQPLFQYIQDHADNLKVIYWALGAAVALVIAALEALFVILVLVTGGIVALGDAIHGSLDALHSGATGVGNWWNGAKDAVGKAIDAIVGKHKDVGQSATDAAVIVGTATGDMRGDWRKTAGPGTDSIEDSTTKIVSDMGGVGTASTTTATTVHTATGNMATDYGNLSAGAETAGGRIRADNAKTQQSNTGTHLDWHSNLSTTLSLAGQFATQIGILNSGIATSFAHLGQGIGNVMSGLVGALHAFQIEHFGWGEAIKQVNLSETSGFEETGRRWGGVFSALGTFGNAWMNLHKNQSLRIGDDNTLLELSHTLLAQTIGRTMKESGQTFLTFGNGIHATGDGIRILFEKDLGPAFSALGTQIRKEMTQGGEQFLALGRAAHDMARDIGNVFSGLAGNIHGGLQAVASALNAFGSAVSRALSPFNVEIKPVATSGYAEGGVVPGYAPGQDIVPAMLSPGEGILTPQTVKAMGGESAIKALNQAGPSLENQMGASGVNTLPGSWGGQCVVFAENLLGTFWPVAMASQLTRYINSQIAKVGEAAVFTGGPFGHVAVVTGAGDGYSFPVIDSNWVANETIGMHTMNRGMYGFAGFIDMGKTLGTMAGLGVPGITSPAGLLDGLVTRALGGLGGWEGTLAKGILGQAVKGITHSLGFDSGGGLPPGGTFAYNGTGRTETVTPAATMDRVEQLLSSIDGRLAQLAGQPRLGAQLAMVRNGG